MKQPDFLERTGSMGELYRQKDWSSCPLGPPEGWPRSLRGYVDMLLRSPNQTILFWGPDQIQLYNLAYSQIMGPRHPRYLGEPYRDCWPDTYPTIYPMMRRVMDLGEVIEVDNALIPVTRYGFVEETYFTFAFVPLRGDTGKIEGFVQFITETTKALIAERRLATLRALAPRIDGTRRAISVAHAAFASNANDVPFAAVFVPSEATGELEVATTTGGLDADRPALLAIGREVMTTGTVRQIDDLTPLAGDVKLGPWEEPARSALVLPLRRAGSEEVRGVVLLGISGRLAFDDPYREFFEAAAHELASNLAFEHENRERARLNLELQRRAEALLALDHAKTAFFSNVSHELRTPLTLMLGPVEDALGDRDPPLGPRQRERLELVQRSGKRLFKLVNTVLDFSRIEAGRTQATFEPTDLATLTSDLAGSFRSLVEKAGLVLDVSATPLSRPTYVDREMWEKIVLNLLSNAFKFTAAGSITVTLDEAGDEVRLTVTDTGSGIPAAELPKLFDRFHRVEGTKGRSFEGTGIGLALVQELVKMHHGEIHAVSQVGKGTTFTVVLRAGSAHLPAERVRHPSREAGTSELAQAYLREAAAWTGEPAGPRSIDLPVTNEKEGRILLADDNADMREYVRRLLEPRFEVETVGDGLAALEAVKRKMPDLVLSDVMMPYLDGFGLLERLKSADATRALPVILVSARAGEESRVEGMQSGADDYLVKPFSARELLARVSARLEIARLHAGMNRELERRVDERTAELQEANRELESFSYSISHDLRAPLRHILGFSQLMEKSTAGSLDPRSAGYLKTIADAAVRGGQLVDDLLAFSRMGRAEMRFGQFELAKLVADVCSELAPDHDGRTIEWRIGDLPRIQGDRVLLKLVLKNLLANALKYTRTRAVAVIEIGARTDPRESELWVRDNGVGFDMRYVDKLFGVFQRLHSSSEFEGTGIGLALVRRIVSRHGGRTWAESALGEGACFHVTLPWTAAPAA